MVVKVYISGISGNKEVKKRQQRVLMILDSKNIKYSVIDITEPGKENDKDFMQNNSKSNGGTVSDPNPRSPLPPQLFNDEEYCGDYDQFDLANEVDTLEQFLKVEAQSDSSSNLKDSAENGIEADIKEDSEVANNNGYNKKNNLSEGDVKDSSPPKDNTAVNEGSPVKETTDKSEEADHADLVKNDEEVKSPTHDDIVVKETSPVKEFSPVNEKSPVKDTSPPKEKSPVKETIPIKEVTDEELKDFVKELSIDKESANKSSKETTPESSESVNENGTVSSRENSEEKENEGKSTLETKENPSEALINSEQQAAAE